MNGILNILKPPGMTSFDVVACLRGLLKMKKIGHTGTLDPIAVGVLPICLGNATKAIEFLTEKDKLYRAELTLGIATDTQDLSGEIISSSDVNCSDQDIINAIQSFIGKYSQLPPMYSAVKINGKKLYELAREGISIERNPRNVEIYSINIVKIERFNQVKVLFDVHCSKGTYIRTLCADIGEKLGCGGHMSFLLRKRAGIFDIASAVTIEELKSFITEGKLSSVIMNVDTVFENLTYIDIDINQEKRLLNGVPILLKQYCGIDSGIVRIYGEGRRFLALGEIIEGEEGHILKSKKFF